MPAVSQGFGPCLDQRSVVLSSAHARTQSCRRHEGARPKVGIRDEWPLRVTACGRCGGCCCASACRPNCVNHVPKRQLPRHAQPDADVSVGLRRFIRAVAVPVHVPHQFLPLCRPAGIPFQPSSVAAGGVGIVLRCCPRCDCSSPPRPLSRISTCSTPRPRQSMSLRQWERMRSTWCTEITASRWPPVASTPP